MFAIFRRGRICRELPEADANLGNEILCKLGRLDSLAFAERMYKSLMMSLVTLWCIGMTYICLAAALMDAVVLTGFMGLCLLMTWAKKYAIGRWYDWRFGRLLAEWRSNPNLLRVLAIFSERDPTAHMMLSACREAEPTG